MVHLACIPALILTLLAGGAAAAPAAPSVDPPPPTGAVAEPQAPEAEQAPKKKVAKKQVAKKKARARCRVYTPPRYRQMAANWRKVPRIPAPRWREGYRDLVLVSVNLGERVRVFPFLPDGSLDPAAVREIERVLRDHHNDALHTVDPRLIKLLYRLADRFDARQITVVSGYRQPENEEGGGHHANGSAVDIALSGVSLPALAKAARQLGRVGVGLYPNAGFIHLDTRVRSYSWVDRSGPGSPGCPVRVATEAGYRADRLWKPEDDEPVPRRDRHGVLLGAAAPPAETDAGPE
jgi:uncharacterized protein YcbK (DUF882 family)